jgi:hypothetical protein
VNFAMQIWQPPDLKQRIKFRGITMPNTIILLKKTDAKADLQRVAMSMRGYAYAAAKDQVWSRSIYALIVQLISTKL